MIKQDLLPKEHSLFYTDRCRPVIRIIRGLLLVLLFLVFLLNCENRAPLIPERPQSIDEHQYAKFREKLLKAYETEDYYLVTFNLANLQSPKKVIYENLRKAVNQDTLACTKIFEVNYLAEQGFTDTSIRLIPPNFNRY